MVPTSSRTSLLANSGYLLTRGTHTTNEQNRKWKPLAITCCEEREGRSYYGEHDLRNLRFLAGLTDLADRTHTEHHESKG